jgi:hypothetical protein
MAAITIAPRNWPKSKVIFAIAALIGMVLVVVWMFVSSNGFPSLAAALQTGIFACALVAIPAISIFAFKTLTGRYSNLECLPWRNQVW